MSIHCGMRFRCTVLRLHFEVRQRVHFPPLLAANVFRGALGMGLATEFFAPLQTEPGPSGLRNPPRPFVLRAKHLDGRRCHAGENFLLTMHLFRPIAAEIVQALRETPPYHGRVHLMESWSEEPVEIPLEPENCETNCLRVQFLTPTELKGTEELAGLPEFPLLFARATGRLRTLSYLYGRPLELDFARLSALAQTITTAHSETQNHVVERKSSRTGRTHPLGGLTGVVQYTGDFRELVPLLRASCYTGVGRQTVWGKGEFTLAFIDPPCSR